MHQVEVVFVELFKRFPDVYELANADDEKLREILTSLGLRWRIPQFKQLAGIIVEKYEGKVPDKRNELLKLPGVGDYVAGAVLSIAYGKKEWMVDSNIARFLTDMSV